MNKTTNTKESVTNMETALQELGTALTTLRRLLSCLLIIVAVSGLLAIAYCLISFALYAALKVPN